MSGFDVVVLNGPGSRERSRKRSEMSRKTVKGRRLGGFGGCGVHHNPSLPGGPGEGLAIRLLKHGGAVLTGVVAGVGGTWILSQQRLSTLQKAGILAGAGLGLGVAGEVLDMQRLGVALMAAPMAIAGLYTLGQLTANAMQEQASAEVVAQVAMTASPELQAAQAVQAAELNASNGAATLNASPGVTSSNVNPAGRGYFRPVARVYGYR
jgi:hypothetical protein